MASYNDYINQYYKDTKSEYEKQKKKITDLSNANLKDANALIEANTQASIKPLEEKKLTLPQQFQSAFDANEIQYLVNQRQLEERMANLGLTDSGLNRTQETALAVQKMNTDAAYNQRKQAAIKSLDDQINEIIATGNLKKQEATLNSSSALRSDLLNLENNYKANAQTYASDMVKADAEAEAARIKAQNTTNSNKRKDFSTKLGYMSNDDLSDSAKLAHIYDYINYYDEDINSTTFLNNDIKTLLSAANITESDWQTYMRNRLGIASIPQAYSKEYTSWLKASKPSLK